MAYVPRYNRVVPVALPAAETIFAVPRPMSRGGDGLSAARFLIDAGATTTSISVTTATGLQWSDFEAAAFTINDRFNGLHLVINGQVVTITDFVGGATATFTVSALIAAPATAAIALLEADIPLYVSAVRIGAFAPDGLRYNIEDRLGLITAGQFETIAAGTIRGIVDSESGMAGFPIHIASDGAGSTTANLEIFVP